MRDLAEIAEYLRIRNPAAALAVRDAILRSLEKLIATSWEVVLPSPTKRFGLGPPLLQRAGLSGASKVVERPQCCTTKEDPRGRAWPGHPRLRRPDCSGVKAWMPGTSPGKGCL